jgi:hypothetical protein
MTVRGFYNTVDHDQIPITFGYTEEKRAFENGRNKISGHASRLHQYGKSLSGTGFTPPSASKNFLAVDSFIYSADEQGRLIATRETDSPLFTTLECEQLRKNIDVVMAIYGLNVCNIHSRSNMTMCIYTRYRWKAEKGWVKIHE